MRLWPVPAAQAWSGNRVILFPDEGKGYEVWRSKIGAIAAEVGFRYCVSAFMEGREQGADIADLS